MAGYSYTVVYQGEALSLAPVVPAPPVVAPDWGYQPQDIYPAAPLPVPQIDDGDIRFVTPAPFVFGADVQTIYPVWPLLAVATMRTAIESGDVVAPVVVGFVSRGREWIFNSPNWSQVEHFFEVYIRLSSGSSVEARLFDVTAGAPVTGSGLRTSSATFVRLRSAALDLTDGSSYRAEVGSDVGATGEALFAGLVSI